MRDDDAEIQARAAALADELAEGIRAGRAVEWVEAQLASALRDVAARTRERCAALAEERAQMWESSERRMSSGGWPREGADEARHRRKEAITLADSFRVIEPGAPRGD